MKTSTWIIVILLIAVALYGLFLVANGDGGDDVIGGNGSQTTTPGVVTDADHVKGGDDAAVILVEYGDFQCPACKAFHPVIKEIEEEFGNDLKIVWRNFPLRTIHPRANVSAQAAEAAALQGKFWEMHDILFENQTDWSSLSHSGALDKFSEYALDIGLNVEQFDEDVNSEVVRSKINTEVSSGQAANISSTPSLFLNGDELNLRSFDQLRQEIIDAIAEQSIDEPTDL